RDVGRRPGRAEAAREGGREYSQPLAGRGASRTSALKLQIDLDGETYSLELEIENGGIRYSVKGFEGDASVVETMPGVFSVLVKDRSFLVSLGPGEAVGSDFEAWPNGEQRHAISVADLRDRSSRRAPGSGN